MLHSDLQDDVLKTVFFIIIYKIANNKPNELLSTYIKNKTTGEFEKDQPNNSSYLKIDDLKSYFKEHLKISCPKQLTGKKPWSGDILSKWKKFQNISNSKAMTIDQSVLSGKVAGKALFPELNIVYLQNIAERWTKDYKKKEVDISRILLYPFASDSSPETNPVKYALVFDISHYERKIVHNSADTNKKDQDKYTIEKLMDHMNILDRSYESFISDTGYMSTLHPSSIGFFYSAFSSVYIDSTPNDFKNEWIFIPAYKHYENTNSGSIRIEEGCVVLYDRSGKHADTKKDINNNKSAIVNDYNDQTNQDIQKKIFKIGDGRWDVTFDGRETDLKNPVSVLYILEAIKNPGVKLPFYKIVDIVQGLNQTYISDEEYKEYSKMGKKIEDDLTQAEKDDNLSVRSRSDIEGCEYSNEETKFAFNKLVEIHFELQDGSEQDKASLEEYVQNFTKEYGHRVYKTNDTIKMVKTKYFLSEKMKKDSESVRKARITIMKKLKNSLPQLYRHFDLYLKVDNGLIYDPPDNNPPWEIIDK